MPIPHRPTAAAAAAALLVSACVSHAPPPPTETGIARELAQVRKATLSDLAYAVALRIPAAHDQPVQGTTTVRFRWSDPGRRPVVLDFVQPEQRVREVRVNGKAARWSAKNDHVVIPASGFRRDTVNEVSLAYTAGDEALNRASDFLYTLFVPDRAHFSLPVFDQPDLKARWSLTLDVPPGWVAVANGPELETPPDTLGGTYRFAETKPLPTYLFAFVAGRFKVEEADRDGRHMRMFHRETDSAKVARNRDAIFDLHATALSWLEDYTGIPYPFQKFDFVLVPSFQYGGMEHPGQILYNQDGILLDESATQDAYLGRASTIAHETTHMWFGDLVTMEWFDDVWMKEVFANFMAAKIVHPSFPEVDHDLRFLLAHFPPAYQVDRTAGANPIRQPLENLREAGTLYGNIIYEKAPIVMRQLELVVGEDAFQDGLREYLSAHEYGNATWPDLIAVLDRKTDDDLAAWSHAWVEEPGRPTVRVTRVEEGGRAGVRIAQEDPAGKGRIWPQPLTVLFGYPDTVLTQEVRLGANTVFVAAPDGRTPDFVLPNGSGVEYGLFLLDPASRAWLLEHLPEVPRALDRGTSWVTLWDAVLEGQVPPATFLDLALAALPREGNEQNAQRVLGYLETGYWRLLSDDARRRRAPDVEGTLWRGVSTAPTATLRAAYFKAWRNVVLTGEGVARLRRVWAREEQPPGVALSENDYTALASTLALRGVGGIEAILDTQAGRIENPDRRARFAFVRPTLSADTAVQNAWFQALKDPANREREPWVLEGLANLNHPLREARSRHFVLPALEMVEEVQRTGDIFFPGRWLDATLGGHGSPEVAETVRAFLDARPGYPPRLRGKIQQSADMVERAARIVYGWTPGGA